MFGFSFLKLIVLLAIIAAVLLGYRYFGSRRVGDRRDRAGTESVEDMERCAVCGDYVSARGARSCGRSDCPY